MYLDATCKIIWASRKIRYDQSVAERVVGLPQPRNRKGLTLNRMFKIPDPQKFKCCSWPSRASPPIHFYWWRGPRAAFDTEGLENRSWRKQSLPFVRTSANSRKVLHARNTGLSPALLQSLGLVLPMRCGFRDSQCSKEANSRKHDAGCCHRPILACPFSAVRTFNKFPP